MLLSATRNPRDAIFDIFISRLQVPRAQFPLARSENEAQAPKRPSCDQFSSRLPHSFASFCCFFFLLLIWKRTEEVLNQGISDSI